jgi:hypothetical protein
VAIVARGLRPAGLVGVALLVTLTACGGGGSGKTKSAAARSSSTTQDTSTTTSTGAGPTAAAGGTTLTTAAKARTPAPAQVNGAPAAAYKPPAGAKAATPSAPGTYRYDTSGSVSFGPSSSALPPVTTLVVDPPAGASQHSTRDLRDAQGNGSVSETTLQFQPQGVLLEELKITTSLSGYKDVEDFRPPSPALILPTGAHPGDHLEFDLSGSGTTVHVTVDVVRTERLVIGGQAVDTIVVHENATFSGHITGSTQGDNWVSPQYDLIVKEHSTTDATSAGVKAHSDQTSTLQKLTP